MSILSRVTQALCCVAVLSTSSATLAAEYPPNIDYGDMGDFLAKRGTEFGRTANLTPIGPILVNFPEGPGSSDVAISRYRFEDTAWDLSDLRNPTLIRSLTCDTCFGGQPVAAHGTVTRFDETLGPILWAGGDYFRYDASGATSDDQLVPQEFFGWGDVEPNSYSRMFAPYHIRTYWEYGMDASGLYSIRDTSRFLQDTSQTGYLGVTENRVYLGEPVVSWDHLRNTGVTGFTAWLGNLLVVASDQQSTGMAIYDVSGFKEGNVPELLSVYQPQVTEPDGHVTGVGGYWVEPYGANKMVFAAREREELIPSRHYPAMFIIDFTDPRNPYLSCEIYFNKDDSDPADGDDSSDPTYVNFQDQYAYVDHFRVDIPGCENAYRDGVISDSEFSSIVYKFNDIANECDSSQYFRPLGQVGIFGGYDWYVTQNINEQGMCFMVTSDEPDTRPPFVSGHRPLSNQTNYPVDGYIHLHIPETLRSDTIMGAVTLTHVDSGADVSFKHQLSHTGTMSIWPDSDMQPNSTYRVSLAGIQDFMGNTMEPYSFSFSTGDSVMNPDPTPTVSPMPTISPSPLPTPNTNTVPSYAGTPFYPNQSSELACENNSDSDHVWVVNPDNDTISILDPNVDSSTLYTEPRLVSELSIGYETPTSVTQVGSDFAVTYQNDDKVVFFSAGGIPKFSVDTGHGTQPIASVADDEHLYVSLYGSAEIVKINLTTYALVARIDVGLRPKAMALHDERLLVTRFISDENGGEVYDLNTNGNMTLVRTIPVNKITVPDDIDRGSGVPNYLSSIVIDENSEYAYIAAVKANIDRGLQRNGRALDGDNTLRPIIVILDLLNNRDANVDPSTRANSIDLDNGADPTGITFLANPSVRVHTLRGNNVVVAQNMSSNRSAQFTAGFAPQQMCTTLRTLYVKNYTDRSVSAIDVAAFMHDGELNPVISTVSTVTQEALSPDELLGLQVFYHSRIPEMGPEGYMSCASCHSSGGHDGMVWDISNMGEGFRNTTSLNGTSGTRFGNLHWSGNFDEVEDFEIQLEQLNEGRGLVDGRTFGSGDTPLNHLSSDLSPDLDALATYVTSLGKDSVSRSPYRTYTGELTDAAERGRAVFDRLDCASCHSGTAFRDGLMHDVGTIKITSGQRLGGILSAIRTPSLIQLWDSAPYYHDGSAQTLEDVLTQGTHQHSLPSQDLSDLVTFLFSIDREMYIEDDELFIPNTAN